MQENNRDMIRTEMKFQGGLSRMSKFPSLLGQRFTVNGIQANVGSKDIVLSSSGWVMITNR